MYDEDIIEVSATEYDTMKDQLTEYQEMLEQLASAYDNLSIDLVEMGEIDLEEILERASSIYNSE